VHRDCIPVLGTAAAAAFATSVGTGSDLACTEAARMRLAKGTQLCEDIRELAGAALPCAKRPPAWQLLSSVANQCLS
jgi:hypothetical protein